MFLNVFQLFLLRHIRLLLLLLLALLLLLGTRSNASTCSESGIIIGVSLGFDSEEYLDGKSVARIGHMGHLNPHMLIGVISSLEIGMTAQNIPHKSFTAEKIYDILNN